MRAARPWLLGSMLALVACAEPEAGDDALGSSGPESETSQARVDLPARPFVELVTPDRWVFDLAADPEPSHRPDDATCDFGFANEDGVFEIDTALCRYAVFTQPLLDEIRQGDTVELTVTHDPLWAEAPAVAHILVRIGEAHDFERMIEIPGPYGLVSEQWIADTAIPAGSPAVLHLHNHGVNNFRFVALVARSP